MWGKKQEQEKVQSSSKQKKNKKDKKKKSKKSNKNDDSSSSSDSDSDGGVIKVNEEEKRLKLLEEIEKVRKRRDNREKELAEMEKLRDEEQRLRELASFTNWKEKEEEFHLEQIKDRAKLRIVEDRCQLIDRFITNIIFLESTEKLITVFQKNYKREIDELLNPSSLKTNPNNPNVKLMALLLNPFEKLSPIEILIRERNMITIKEISSLMDDITQLKQLDEKRKETRYLVLWNSLLEVLKIMKERKTTAAAATASASSSSSLQSTSSALFGTNLHPLISSSSSGSSSLHPSVQNDVEEFLRHKSMKELENLEKDIQLSLKEQRKGKSSSIMNPIAIGSSGSSGSMDIDYWEYMLQEIVFQKNKILIIQCHSTILNDLLKGIEQLNEYGMLKNRSKDNESMTVERKHYRPSELEVITTTKKSSDNKQRGARTTDGSSSSLPDSVIDQYMNEIEKNMNLGVAGGYDDDDEEGVEESEEMKMLQSDEILLPLDQVEQQLLQQSNQSQPGDSSSSSSIKPYLPSYSFSDKYRPRKPRYFNRVKTGWDRNKYNLTHYDSDNPPPKMIQGYKFTIFYPDLIDKTITPKFFIEACPDSSSKTLNDPNNPQEFVMIRFHAGPPYQDIAFKIVNRQWDTYKRAGFVNVFEHGVLQLHFNFKRQFYRR
jgi:hypothetical protein